MAKYAAVPLIVSCAVLLLATSHAVPLPQPSILACTPYSAQGLCAPVPSPNPKLQAFKFGVNAKGGSGLVSKQSYLSGHFSLTLRLPKENSAGVNFGFYLMDSVTQRLEDPRHTEIDFEFVGAANSTAVTAVLSVIAGEMQNVARVKLPFDPAAAFHTYTIRWNAKEIAWIVDNKPIRILQREFSKPWPARAMVPQVAVWQAPWSGARNIFATGPVMAVVAGFRALGCTAANNAVSMKLVECHGPWNFAMQNQHQNQAAKFASAFQIADHGWTDLS